MNYRNLRIAGLIQKYLSELLARDLEFPNALVTITDVDVTSAMDTASVKVSVVPSSRAHDALTILTAAQGDLQHRLLLKLNIKPMPRIQFELDRGAENAAEVEKILLKENNSDA